MASLPKTELKLNERDLKALLPKVAAASQRGFDRRAGRVLQLAKRSMPKRSGRTAASGKQTFSGRGFSRRSLVQFGGAAGFIERGTGIFGPRRAGIRVQAKPGRVLSFVANGRRVFAKSVFIKGTKPRPILADANEAAMTEIKQKGLF